MTESAPHRGKYELANVGGLFITLGRGQAEKVMGEQNIRNRAG